jgi:hypothetical protein
LKSNNAEEIPVNVCGSSKFSIWPKASLEKTYNMYISDGWMLSFPGYESVALESTSGKGRGVFRSIRGKFLLAVIGSGVYLINSSLAAQFVGNINTNTGEVSIDENLSNQICIVDGVDAYIYSYTDAFSIGILTQQSLGSGIVPGYVSFHNELFLIASAPSSTLPQRWFAYAYASSTTISLSSTYTISTKPDKALAVIRVPGRGNNIIVFGSAVTEIWTYAPTIGTGGTALAYQRISSYNIDNGCVSIATISAGDDIVAWLAQNENNSPVIMTSNGSETMTISTDGIDHVMRNIKFPAQSTAFFFKQNGHLFYQLTFTNKQDNLTLIYDFASKQFFHLTDHEMNYHPAADVVYFNGKSYFISLNDAYLYEIGDQFDTANGELIPRIRICKTIRKEDNSIFRLGYFTFWIEQGVNKFTESISGDGIMITQDNDVMLDEDNQIMVVDGGSVVLNNNRPRVDMSFSKDGNQSFSNVVSRELNTQAHFRNRLNWYRMGQANELTIQLRFWGFNRFLVTDGVAECW